MDFLDFREVSGDRMFEVKHWLFETEYLYHALGARRKELRKIVFELMKDTEEWQLKGVDHKEIISRQYSNGAGETGDGRLTVRLDKEKAKQLEEYLRGYGRMDDELFNFDVCD